MKSVLALLCACLCAVVVFAQANATLGGTAIDSSGALVPGVTITARNVNTGVSLTVITNESGSYQCASLQPGPYRVTATRGLARKIQKEPPRPPESGGQRDQDEVEDHARGGSITAYL